MKVIILAGGFGTRLAEFTDVMPKPMVPIGGRPILWHIMQSFAHFGHEEFIVALGYKGDAIKKYFLNYPSIDSNFTVSLRTGEVTLLDTPQHDWSVTLIDTGSATMTGGRVKRVSKFLNGETCLLTYGDGLADINIDDLIKFHRRHRKMITVTAVHPSARFGELDLMGDVVRSFKEKPQVNLGWVNGGFFVVEPEFFNLIDNDNTVLEQEPLERAAEMGELVAYKHEGFWQCMDTKRDHELLESMYRNGSKPWMHQR